MNAEEVIMKNFILMCQQSLDPPRYEAFLDICEYLCKVRTKGLCPDSLERCLQAVYVPIESDVFYGELGYGLNPKSDEAGNAGELCKPGPM